MEMNCLKEKQVATFFFSYVFIHVSYLKIFCLCVCTAKRQSYHTTGSLFPCCMPLIWWRNPSGDKMKQFNEEFSPLFKNTSALLLQNAVLNPLLKCHILKLFFWGHFSFLPSLFYIEPSCAVVWTHWKAVNCRQSNSICHLGSCLC